MDQVAKAKLNWELMELIVKHSNATLFEVAETKHYATTFHMVEHIVETLLTKQS